MIENPMWCKKDAKYPRENKRRRCGDCKYFVAFRNMNYETSICDTITEYCELLQNEETYDRDKGDEIWNSVFDDCPLRTGFVLTESVIKLLQSRKFLQKQFDDYVDYSCKEKEFCEENSQNLKKANKQLKERLYEFEKRKIIEEREVDEDVIPKIKLLRTELFGEKYE